MVSSRKGIGGGFVLAMRPETILVGNIVTALQGPVRISDCDARKAICTGHRRCVLRRKLKIIEGQLISELMSISVASLAE